jgi:hypothetical protein
VADELQSRGKIGDKTRREGEIGTIEKIVQVYCYKRKIDWLEKLWRRRVILADQGVSARGSL